MMDQGLHVKFLVESSTKQGDFPGGSDGKESACKAGDPGSSPGWEDPQRRKWQPTPVFLPGKSHGQRNLAG